MMKHNPENERIKHRYLIYLKEAKGHSEQSLDVAAKALSRFEEYTGYRSFKAFHFEQAVAFKRNLANQTGKSSGEKLSKATLHATLRQLTAFFFWLAGQPGYKAHLEYSDSDYFKLSEKDTRIATAQRERKAPTLEQVKYVIELMPSGTEIERRNRALLAFTLLTGARDSAIASFKLKRVNLTEGCVHHDARDVKTKFSKTFVTTFFQVGDGIQEIVADWVRFLREEKLWGNDDPLFPATRIVVGPSHQFETAGLERAHWSSTGPIRTIFRDAFERAGLPYFHPHSIRHMLTLLAQRFCSSAEEYKAWSQNLGHERVLTTFLNYGSVAADRQSEIIRGLGAARQSKQPDVEELAEALARRLKGQGAGLPSAQ